MSYLAYKHRQARSMAYSPPLSGKTILTLVSTQLLTSSAIRSRPWPLWLNMVRHSMCQVYQMLPVIIN